MSLSKVLSYIALVSALTIMLHDYMPSFEALMAIVASIMVVSIATAYYRRFEHRVHSVYGALAWSSGLFLVYYLTRYAVYQGGTFALLYTIYLVLGVSSIAVVAAKSYGVALQNVNPRYALLGAVLGIVTGWFVMAIPLNVVPLIGATVSSLASFGATVSAFDVSVATFIVMLYLVAVPEEMLGRVFGFHVGAIALSPSCASVASVILGYALHAITRYPDFGSLIIVTVVWSLVTAFYASTRSLIGAVLFHATYNTVVVVASIYGVFNVFIATLPIVLAVAVYVLTGGGSDG
jgi:CAAX amino terminal protease family.